MIAFIKYAFVGFIFMLLTFEKGASQNYNDPNNVLGNPQNPNNLPQSNNFSDSTAVEDSTETLPKDKFNWKNNPRIASIASAVIPGGGQFYNQKYWKIPIVWGLMGTFAYLIVENNKRYNDFRKAFIYLKRRNPDNFNAPPLDSAFAEAKYNEIYERHQNEILKFNVDSVRNSNLLSFRRDDARRTRDWMAIFFILTYVCNIMDAAVDAHFATFDVSDKLSMDIKPAFLTDRAQPMIGINLTVSMKDHRRKYQKLIDNNKF